MAATRFAAKRSVQSASQAGSSARGAGSAADTGFYFNAGSGFTLTVTSSGNLVTDVGTARTLGAGVTMSPGI